MGDECDGTDCLDCPDYPCIHIDLAGGPECTHTCPENSGACFDCPERAKTVEEVV